jgi:phosphatidylglycerol:prolipoprotein diacylglycerol transferase
MPRIDVVQSDKEARTSGELTALLESATQEILAVTYWFDPAPHLGPYPVTVRFSGRRVDVKGRLSPSDRFVHDETIEHVIPGSGPISLTARIHGINPGEWVVTARMLGVPHPAHGPREQRNAIPAAGPLPPAARFWRRWAPSAASAETVRTCLLPFARVPGIFPGIWGALVTLGIAVALVLQSLLLAGAHLAVGPVWTVSLVQS